jgi:hypothetical protein
MKRKGNRITVDGDVASIHMTGGHVALIDAADVELAEEATWYADKDGYVKTKIRAEGTSHYQAQLLHRHIMKLPAGHGHERVVDHLNRDRLDNRRANLQVTTNRENAVRGYLSALKADKTSRFVGVCWDTRRGCWIAQVHNKVEKRNTRIGRYRCELQAAAAYQKAVRFIESRPLGSELSDDEIRAMVRAS